MSNELNPSGEGTSNSEPKEAKSEKSFNEFCEKTLSRTKFLAHSEFGVKKEKDNAHMRRLKNLRKELNYIKATEWMYDPVDKRIGQ